MFSVEFLAVDTRLSVPLEEPTDDGVKVTVKVTLWFEERLVGTLSPVKEKPDPLIFASEMVTADVPVLVTVSDSSALLLLGTFPKESEDALAAKTEPASTGGEPLEATPPQPVRVAIPAAIKTEVIRQRHDGTECTGTIPQNAVKFWELRWKEYIEKCGPEVDPVDLSPVV
jgi:hypothetical protein